MKNLVLITLASALFVGGYAGLSRSYIENRNTLTANVENGIGGQENASEAPGAWLLAQGKVAEKYNTEARKVFMLNVVEKQWPDACLGVSHDQMCAQVITPGYQFMVEVGERAIEVRSNEDGSVVRFVD